jgi:hypothetical protein
MEIGPHGILFVGKGEELFFSIKGKSSPECKLLMIQLAGCNKIRSKEGLKVENYMKKQNT